jgi:glycine/D-amino acid oxidase-like deaminating enzyme
MTAETDVAVVGSGAMAGAAAWELARAGLRPVLVFAPGSEPEVGHVASGPDRAYAEVVREIGRGLAREIWELHRESHERLRAFVAGLARDCGYRKRGAFVLALDRERAAFLAETEDLLREDGFAGEFLDHFMLETRLPLFGFAGGYWAADDAEVDERGLAEALRSAARDRGATVADVGAVLEIAPRGGGVEVVGERGRLIAGRAVVADAAALAAAGRPGMTRTATVIGAAVTEGYEVPPLVRSGDGRFRWQAQGAGLRLEVDPGLDAEELLGRIPVRETTGRGVAIVPSWEDRLPLLGPVAEGAALVLACSREPCGIAFTAARGIAEWLRTGRDSTARSFRAARLWASLPPGP